jgi:hypothetical protein
MAKQFLYASLGFLCLVAAYQLGVEKAAADWDLSVPGEIVGASGDNVHWDRSGRAWNITRNGWTRYYEDYDLPVPPEEVKFISKGWLVTTSDVGWVFGGGGVGWECAGPYPGGPVPLKSDSWGKIKSKYHD